MIRGECMIPPHLFTIDPHILRSINKSILRRKVLFYLYSIHPNADYLSNISRVIRSDATNVLGCIKGMGNRYNGSSSLIELGLVEVVERDGFKYYRITELGRKVVEYVKKVYGEI